MTKSKERWLGWYFAETSRKLRYGDDRLIRVGGTHRVKGKPILCAHGLHASKTVLQALQYAHDHVLYRVSLSGIVVHDNDKSVATARTYLACIDAEKLLREFARKCALQCIHLWNCPRVVKEWLETGNPKLRNAAESAGRNGARRATRSTAWSAAWSAAESAARRAALSAALSAAEKAAESAAWSAAQSATWSATRSAAWSAARSAALSAQSAMLEDMCLAAIKKQRK